MLQGPDFSVHDVSFRLLPYERRVSGHLCLVKQGWVCCHKNQAADPSVHPDGSLAPMLHRPDLQSIHRSLDYIRKARIVEVTQDKLAVNDTKKLQQSAL